MRGVYILYGQGTGCSRVIQQKGKTSENLLLKTGYARLMRIKRRRMKSFLGGKVKGKTLEICETGTERLSQRSVLLEQDLKPEKGRVRMADSTPQG
jgi:hypothetical protein